MSDSTPPPEVTDLEQAHSPTPELEAEGGGCRTPRIRGDHGSGPVTREEKSRCHRVHRARMGGNHHRQ